MGVLVKEKTDWGEIAGENSQPTFPEITCANWSTIT